MWCAISVSAQLVSAGARVARRLAGAAFARARAAAAVARATARLATALATRVQVPGISTFYSFISEIFNYKCIM